MTLLTRLGRLLRADLNAVLDDLEEPATLLRQATREMQSALDAEHSEAARLGDEAQRLAQAAQECATRLAALDEELTLCFAADADALARDLVRRKLETARHAGQLEERRQALAEARQRLAARIAEHAQRLQALRNEASLHETLEVARDDHARSVTATAPISAAEIEVALLRERQRRAQS
ncbi:MAG: PspA/IM30 family protein [Gammaproteobacteria bacterium]|nr:PspA/IM30 family protein [Gammaproteobacteria bacterium]